MIVSKVVSYKGAWSQVELNHQSVLIQIYDVNRKS